MNALQFVSKLNRAALELYGKTYEKLTSRQKQEARDWFIQSTK